MKRLFFLLFLTGSNFCSEAGKSVNSSLFRSLIAMPDQDFIQMLQAAPNLMNMADDYGRTLLLYSILKSERNKMNSLLLQGANAKVTDKEGNTGLHYAATHPNAHAVNELTRRQASTKAVNTAGQTPLHRLAEIEIRFDDEPPMSKEIAKTAESILSGSSVLSWDLSLLSIVDNANMTPVDTAIHFNNVPVLCVFLDVCTNRLGGVVADTSSVHHKIPGLVVDKISEHFSQHRENLISLVKQSSQVMLNAYKEHEKLKAELQQKTRELEELKKAIKS